MNVEFSAAALVFWVLVPEAKTPTRSDTDLVFMFTRGLAAF